MTVEELRKLLSQFSPETQVVFTYDYGDYLHTSVAKKITEVTDGPVIYSAYHQMFRLAEDRDFPEADGKTEDVVILG